MLEVAGILIRQGDEFVLQHRDNNPSIADPGIIGPWGGKIEPEDKTPEDAAVRELLEETGVKTDKKSLIHLISYETTAKTPKNLGKPIVVHLYLLELGTDVVVRCFEGQEVFRVKTINDVPVAKQSEFLVKSMKSYESTR